MLAGSDILKKQRIKESNKKKTHCNQKNKNINKKMNKIYSQMFLKVDVPNVYRKSLISGEISSGLKTCTTLIVGIFE